MFVDHLTETAVLLELQRALSYIGLRDVASFFVALGVVVLLVDYARMIYLHFKMVRMFLEDPKNTNLLADSGTATWSIPVTYHRKHASPPR
jgi:hypothetical protein